MGADGWRLDVGGDIDPGLTNDPGNSYWEGFRKAIKNSNLTRKSDDVIIISENGRCLSMASGRRMDSVMNYRLRSAL